MQHVKISKSQFKARALEYFRQIESTGEAVLLTDHGKPVLEIRPYREKGQSPLDLLRGSVLSYSGATEPVDVEWEAKS